MCYYALQIGRFRDIQEDRVVSRLAAHLDQAERPVRVDGG
jgi:hypothetical protein